MDKINLTEKLSHIREVWTPGIIGQLNDAYIKLAKLKGEFIWHQHDAEDELFFVVRGRLLLQFRDRDVWLEEGELLIVPKGVEHMPVAQEEVRLMLIEPKTTVNTGDDRSDRTVEDRWI